MTDTAAQIGSNQDIALFLGPQRHIVLSPHYDDTTLSIGASVAQLGDASRDVIDAIIFGSEPDPSLTLSAFAQRHHDEWGLTTAEVVSSRRAEEANAARILGLQVAYLPFHDAIYRNDHYTTNERLFGSIIDAEHGLSDDVARAAKELAGGETALPNADVRFYAPLGVGRHVDHQIATQAGLALYAEGWDVWFYEDIPYSLIGDNHARRLAELEEMGLAPKPVAAIPVESGWERKVDAVMAYPSQLTMVFTNYAGVAASREAIGDAMRRYHAQVGNGTPVERFWVLGSGE